MLPTPDDFLVLYVPGLKLIFRKFVEVNKKVPVNFKELIKPKYQGKILHKIRLFMCGNWVGANIKRSRPLNVWDIRKITWDTYILWYWSLWFLSWWSLGAFDFPKATHNRTTRIKRWIPDFMIKTQLIQLNPEWKDGSWDGQVGKPAVCLLCWHGFIIPVVTQGSSQTTCLFSIST